MDLFHSLGHWLVQFNNVCTFTLQRIPHDLMETKTSVKPTVPRLVKIQTEGRLAQCVAVVPSLYFSGVRARR